MIFTWEENIIQYLDFPWLKISYHLFLNFWYLNWSATRSYRWQEQTEQTKCSSTTQEQMSKLSSVACRDPSVQLVFLLAVLFILEAPCQGPTATGILCQPSLSLARERARQKGETKCSVSRPYIFLLVLTLPSKSSATQLLLNECLLIDLWNVIGDSRRVIGHFSKECLG